MVTLPAGKMSCSGTSPRRMVWRCCSFCLLENLAPIAMVIGTAAQKIHMDIDLSTSFALRIYPSLFFSVNRHTLGAQFQSVIRK